MQPIYIFSSMNALFVVFGLLFVTHLSIHTFAKNYLTMSDLFTLENLGALLMLILLQAVLGFDNLLYISLESQKAPLESQSRVRKIGIGLAIVLRIILLFVLVSLINLFENELFGFNNDFIEGHFTLHSIIVLFGGGFIIYTAVKEIWHMISRAYVGDSEAKGSKKTSGQVIFWIVLMNLIFSFDSILSAMALTSHIGNDTTEITLMTIAIIASGIMMIVLADRVSQFLKQNRMFEVLGLFVLLIVGVMLLTEGGHHAHMHLFGNPIVPMNKTTFYFVIVVLVLVDIVQTRYKKNIDTKAELHKNKIEH